MMYIELSPEMALLLETITGEVGRQEFSGFGFATQEGDHLRMYDFILLDVGSEGYTEIDSEVVYKLSERPDARNMRIWVHRHPIGRGVPGPENWSGTDNATIRECPLGGIPQLIGWSASIVRTPRGWVGRIDNHVKGTTAHVEVKPTLDAEIFSQVGYLVSRFYARQDELREEWLKQQAPFVEWGREWDESENPELDDPEGRQIALWDLSEEHDAELMAALEEDLREVSDAEFPQAWRPRC